MRIRRLKFRKPWKWLPDCIICKIPVCGNRWFQGGSYDCEKRKIWNKYKDMEKVREWQRNINERILNDKRNNR